MTVSAILCAVLTAYMLVLIARALLSWFPVRPGGVASSISMILRDLTEPVLAPARRVIPPAGMFDLSFLVVMFAVIILRAFVCNL